MKSFARLYRIVRDCSRIATLGIAATCAILGNPAASEGAQPTIKILIIGNEMSNGVAANVKDLFESTGRTATVTERTLSGWTLADHYNSATTKTKIESDEWDYILLQEEATGTAETLVISGVTQYRYNSIRNLKAYIDSHTDAETALLMTWRNKGVALSTYDSLRGVVGGNVGYVPIAHELGIRVLPVGWTFRNLVAANSSVDLWQTNNYLANGDGKYVAALAIYSALSAESVVGHYRSGINATTAANYKEKASDTVLAELPVWNIAEPTVWKVRPRVLDGDDDVTAHGTDLVPSGSVNVGGYCLSSGCPGVYDFAARVAAVQIPKNAFITKARLFVYPVVTTGQNWIQPFVDNVPTPSQPTLSGLLFNYNGSALATDPLKYFSSAYAASVFPAGQYSEVPLPFESGVQSIVDYPEWVAGNPMRFVLGAGNVAGAAAYEFKSYNNNPILAPYVEIEYIKNFRAIAIAQLVNNPQTTGRTVSLTGVTSWDPDGDPLTFEWTLVEKPSGSNTILAGASTITPTFVPDLMGTYRVQLRVKDAYRFSSATSLNITVNNQPPVCDAGPARSQKALSTITLTGSASDPNQNQMVHLWTLSQQPPASTTSFTNASTLTPSLYLDRVGPYLAKLTTADWKSTCEDETPITATNIAPVANAGANQGKHALLPFNLNGTGSSDADGHALTYAWSLVSKPPMSGAAITNPTTSQPTLTPDKVGQYTAQLVVSDTLENSPPATVLLNSTNQPPVPSIVWGPGTVFKALLSNIIFSSSGTTDPDGDPLTYSWSITARPAGSTVQLSTPTATSSSFTPDKVGDYTVRLVVTDPFTSAEQSVTITASNVAPVANAGSAQSKHALQSFTLNGTGSSDADGHSLTYSWTLTSKPSGSTATITNPTSSQPTLTPDKVGSYTAQLVVSDSLTNSAPATVTVTSTNDAPVGSIAVTPAQVKALITTVSLNGTGSSDNDNDPITYAWSITSRPAGSTVQLTNPNSATATFIPDEIGDYGIRLLVSDPFTTGAEVTAVVQATNTAPVANAGSDTSGVALKDTIALSGTGSTDADGHSLGYAWTIVSKPAGSTAALAGPATSAPTIAPDKVGAYTIELVVNDPFTTSTPDQIIVTATNTAPVADAGPDGESDLDEEVTLDGSASDDPDGHSISFDWQLTEKPVGSQATLGAATTSGPTFTPDVMGNYTVELVVSDPFVSSPVDSVVITAGNARPVANAGADTNGTTERETTLDATASTDADNDPLTYEWTILAKPAGSAPTLTDADTVEATLIPDVKGDYDIQLRVHDGFRFSFADVVRITVDNDPPACSAGADPASRSALQSVTITGATATDPDQNTLTYEWNVVSRPTGSTSELTSPATLSPSLVLDQPGNYSLELTVSDGRSTCVDTIAPVATNETPVADAGADQTKAVLQTATLDGSGSSDADAHAITYAWSITSKPNGSTAALSDASVVNPSLVLDKIGNYTVELIVSDPFGSSVADVVSISASNDAPISDAGPARTVTALHSTTLDGSGSSDPDDHPITYAWTLVNKPAGSLSVLGSATTAHPTLTPDRVGTYTAQLIVNDSFVDSSPDTVQITSTNVAPVANAGSDVSVNVIDPVELNGTGSSDADGHPLTYAWTIIGKPSGSNASLVSASTATPSLEMDKTGSYTVRLIVSDPFASSTADTVVVTATNAAPVVDAGDDITIEAARFVELDGDATDADDNPLTYTWTLVSKPQNSRAVLTGAATLTPRLVTDYPGTYVARLVASDSIVNSAPDEVVITATDPAQTAPTKLVGRLMDGTKAALGQEVPIVGAVVSLLTYGSAVVTRPDGTFELAAGLDDADTVDVNTDNAIAPPTDLGNTRYANFREAFKITPGITNTIPAPIYLPQVSSAATSMIQPCASPPCPSVTVANTALNIEMVVAPNSVYKPDGTLYTGPLSISEVPLPFGPAALPPLLNPKQLITIQPVGLKIDPPAKITFPNNPANNGLGLVQGSRVDIWSLDPNIGRFSVVGVGKVAANGTIKTVGGGIRATDWHFPAPPPPVGAPSDPPPPDPCKAGGAPTGSTTEICSGSLRETHKLVSYRSLEQERQLELVYESLGANPQLIVPWDSTIPARSPVPSKTEIELDVPGLPDSTPVFTNSSTLSESVTETIRQRVILDARTAATGIYDSKITLRNHFGPVNVGTEVTGSVNVINKSDSPFGAGWSLAGLDRLHVQGDGRILLEKGSGGGVVFESSSEGELVRHKVLLDRKIERFGRALVGDFNNDAKPDILIAGGGGISVFRGTGVADFEKTPLRSPSIGSTVNAGIFYPNEQAAADYNLDGCLDLLVAGHNGDGQVRLVPGKKTGASCTGEFNVTASEWLSGGATRSSDGLVVDDLDNDGLMDVATLAPFEHAAIVWRGTGPGTFGPATVLSMPTTRTPRAIVAADFDQDGKKDIATANLQSISLYMATGTEFAPEVNFDIRYEEEGSFFNAATLAVGDFNADGFPDLVSADNGIATYSTDIIYLFTNNGLPQPHTGFFPNVRTEMNGGTNAQSIAVGDFDGDGLDDIVTGNGAGTLSLRFGNGASEFGEQRDLQIDNVAPFLTLADIDSNGTLDVVTSFNLGANGTQIGIQTNGSVAGTFASSLGDYSKLTLNGDGTYTRRMKDGTRISFSADGLQTAITDTNNNATQYLYDGQDRLTRITDPVGLETTFAYSGGYLSSITDPAGRTTTLTHDGAGDLRSVRDPDLTTRQFAYGTDHKLTSQTSKRGFVTTYAYGLAGRNVGASRPDGSQTVVLPAELDRLANVPGGVGTLQNPAPVARVSTIQATVTDGRGKTTSYKTDAFGALTTKTDPLGRTTRTSRDGSSNATVVDYPNGRRDTFRYDADGSLLERIEAVSSSGPTVARKFCFEYESEFGRLISETDPVAAGSCDAVLENAQNKRRSYLYDATGNLETVTDQAGHTRTYTYDTRGMIASYTNERGKTWFTTYDGMGNLETVTDPQGAIVTMLHDAAGNLISFVEGTGSEEERVTQLQYDSMNRVEVKTDGSGVAVYHAFDDSGNCIATQLATGETVTREFDSRDRLEAIQDPKFGRTDYELDGEGHVVSLTNDLQAQTTATYDDAGQLVQLVDAEGGVQTTQYDLIGRPTLVIDAKGQRTKFDYDARGRITKRTKLGTVANPYDLSESYTYDLRDNLLSRKNEKNQIVSMTYDERARLRQISSPVNGTIPADIVQYTYDPAGNMLTAVDSDTSLAFAYDDVGRRVSETSSIVGGSAVTLTSSYDLVGDRHQLIDSLGGSASMSYDGAGRLASVEVDAGTVVLSRDISGRVTEILYPSDAKATYDYDQAGRVGSIEHEAPSGSSLASYNLAYNDIGAVQAVTEAEPPRSRVFGYDGLQRLTSEESSTSGVSLYQYDAVGNRVSSPTSTVFVYDSLNRMLSDGVSSYEYDETGNLVAKTTPSGTGSPDTVDYYWDARGRLVALDSSQTGSVSYRYDALGRRVQSSSTSTATRFVYDHDEIALELNSAGAVQKRYRYGDSVDRPLVLEDASQTPSDSYFYHADHQGSIRLLTDEAGDVADRYDYDAYGVTSAPQSNVDQRFRFTGREWDSDSQLYYYRARYYDPHQGRFISEDPIGFSAGDPNLYRYVWNDPVNQVDPSGQAVPIVIVIGTCLENPICASQLFWLLAITGRTLGQLLAEAFNPEDWGLEPPPEGKCGTEQPDPPKPGPPDPPWWMPILEFLGDWWTGVNKRQF